jgi:hypothetical protein
LKEKEKHPFHLFSLSPPKFLLEPFFFPLILRFYFTMVLNCHLTFFFFFPWPINYNHTSWCTKFSTHSSSNWFWLKIFFFFSLNSWCRTWSLLMGLKLHKWMKNHLWNHP